MGIGALANAETVVREHLDERHHHGRRHMADACGEGSQFDVDRVGVAAHVPSQWGAAKHPVESGTVTRFGDIARLEEAACAGAERTQVAEVRRAWCRAGPKLPSVHQP